MTPAPPDAAPYATSIDHLRAEIDRSSLRLRAGIARAHTPRGGPALSPEEELFALLDRGNPSHGSAAARPSPAVVEAEAQIDRMAATIARRAAASAAPLRLACLAARFDLTRLDLDLLLLALLLDVDPDAARLFARLDPEGRERLTAGAAIAIVAPALEARLEARARLHAHAPLVRHELVRLAPDSAGGRAPLLARALEIDERIAAHLEGDDALDARLGPHVRLGARAADLDALILPEALKRGLERFLTAPRPEADPAPVIHVEGPPGAGKRALVAAICARLGAPLLTVDCAALIAAGDAAFAATARIARREATLRGAALCWIDADTVLDDAHAAARDALIEAVRAHGSPSFMTGRAPFQPDAARLDRPFVRVALPRPSAADQAQLWDRAIGEARAPDVDVATLTGAFRLTGGQILAAAAAARDLARFDGEGRVRMADVTAACRGRHGKKLAALARRIDPRHGWDDLVLPPDRKAALRELRMQLEHRSRVLGAWGFERTLVGGARPLAALFAGPPGTGKTMAASVIAADLGVDLYQIDLGQVVSKYIGETEKHLGELFADAEASSAGLFFDEADALFGRRTEVRDAHDRWANLETSYLLQRIEAHDGVVILASNLTKNIDEALLRRLGFVIEFPLPGPGDRLRIWQALWPEEAPLAPDVDLSFLADRVDLSGGYLRNIALAAAFLAADEGTAVGMKHLLHAARREYQKVGKVVDMTKLSYPARAGGER